MKKILVATDFSDRSRRAVERGATLAHDLGASLCVLNVIDDDQPEQLIDAEEREAKAILEKLSGTLDLLNGIDSVTRIEFGEPFLRIVETAQQISADLIVVGAHRRRVLHDLFIGTTAERTVRHSACPVLMANTGPATYRHIAVCTDFSDASVEALRTAARLAMGSNALLTAIHVFQAYMPGTMISAAMGVGDEADFVTDKQAEAERTMIEILRNAKVENAAVQLVRAEPYRPVAELLLSSTRDMDADIIVVGTHGKGAVKRLLLGSVTEQIFTTDDIDILAVPPR